MFSKTEAEVRETKVINREANRVRWSFEIVVHERYDDMNDHGPFKQGSPTMTMIVLVFSLQTPFFPRPRAGKPESPISLQLFEVIDGMGVFHSTPIISHLQESGIQLQTVVHNSNEPHSTHNHHGL